MQFIQSVHTHPLGITKFNYLKNNIDRAILICPIPGCSFPPEFLLCFCQGGSLFFSSPWVVIGHSFGIVTAYTGVKYAIDGQLYIICRSCFNYSGPVLKIKFDRIKKTTRNICATEVLLKILCSNLCPGCMASTLSYIIINTQPCCSLPMV